MGAPPRHGRRAGRGDHRLGRAPVEGSATAGDPRTDQRPRGTLIRRLGALADTAERVLQGQVAPEARHRPGAAARRSGFARSLPRRGGPGLELMRQVGCLLLGLQLVGMLVFSVVEYQRYSLTADYAFYAHALYQLAHAHLSANFFKDHGEIAFVLLAPLYWLWPHGPVLLVAQDVAVVGAELVAFLWLCDIAGTLRDPRSRGRPRLFVLAALVALLANPWIWWTIAFDFHLETVGVLFTVLCARDLHRQRGWVWLWAALALLCGDVVTTYVIGLALGFLLYRRQWLFAIGLLAAPIGWFALLHASGAEQGSSYLAPVVAAAGQSGTATSSTSGLAKLSLGLLAHPAKLLSSIWSQRLNVWADVASAGFLGILAPLILFVPLVVIIENALYGTEFIQPTFQSIPIYVFLPVGAVLVLTWLARRNIRVAMVLALAMMLETSAWGIVWLPRTASQWIRVPAASVGELAKFGEQLPNGAPLVVSQGVAGRFAQGRDYDVVATTGGSVVLFGTTTWFLVTPNIGIESAPTAAENALVATLAASPRARPVVVGDGVWGFRYRPRPHEHRFTLPGIPNSLPAWLFTSASGSVETTGPASDWRVVSAGKAGYLVWEDYWSEPEGPATATAELAGHGPVSVEVWDVTENRLLARNLITLGGGGRVEARIPFTVPAPRLAPPFDGVGPFSARFVAPGEDQLEVRVYLPAARTQATAYAVGIS